MQVTHIDLNGPILFSLPVHRDDRGFFVERYRAEQFEEYLPGKEFVQDNHSRSRPGVLRGLHYQRNPEQGKLVGAIRGRIWDVAVDIRAESLTFGKSFGTELSDENGRLLWIPAGFAHGFCVLGDEPADVLYKVDASYNAAGEGGIHWADPDLAISWPLLDPIVSQRDEWLDSFATYRAKALARDLELASMNTSPLTAK
jgi:dTDP-4-dehydrorhamnose 3,5-epimerase